MHIEPKEVEMLNDIAEAQEAELQAPEADEQVEPQGPKLLTKAQVNHRKGLATRMDQAAKFAGRHQIEMLAFYEGVNAPMDIKAPCTAHLVRTVVMHLATYANTEFNEALRMLQAARDEINAKQAEQECSDSPAISTQEESEPSTLSPE